MLNPENIFIVTSASYGDENVPLDFHKLSCTLFAPHTFLLDFFEPQLWERFCTAFLMNIVTTPRKKFSVVPMMVTIIKDYDLMSV